MNDLLPRVLLMVASIAAWFFTQRLISRKAASASAMYDYLHELTAGANRYLNANPRAANALLISSSLGIDLLVIYILAYSLLGESFAPFWGLLVLFFLRQLSQFALSLPIPEGMLWRHPGFPSLFVTYGVSNDLFFSGHTALAVYGACLLSVQGPAFFALGLLLACFEICTVIVLRAHWTADVITGILAALLVAGVVL